MSQTESVYRILSILECGEKHRTLRALAKEAGFKSAAAKPFKQAFNYLISEGIIKVHKGGWTSERGSGAHEDGIVLVSNIYRYEGDTLQKDEDLPLSLGIPHVPEKEHVKYGKDGSAHPCAKCREYDNPRKEQTGTCKKLGWGIDKQLALHHRLCSY